MKTTSEILTALSTAALLLTVGCGDAREFHGTDFPPPIGGTAGAGGTGGVVDPNGDLSVSGTITTAAFTFIDGDTNNPSNPRHDNNFTALSDVQSVGSPAVVGGYLGAIGPAYDVDDVYSVTLTAGQGATLFIGDAVSTDFELFLIQVFGDGSMELVGASVSTGGIEEVVAPTAGEFLVWVTSCLDPDCYNVSGPGLYNLTVGNVAGSINPSDKLSPLDEFVEGDILVPETEHMLVAQGQVAGRWYRMDDDFDLSVMRRAPVVERWKVRAKRKRFQTLATPTVAFDRSVMYSPTIDAVKRLRRAGHPTASPNYVRHATALPNDEFYDRQWHYPIIGLPQAWDIAEGAGTIVAVLDTGIVLDHPDLRNQLVAGYDFVSDVNDANDGDGIDADPSDPGDSGASFHGTHVAGTVAAETHNRIGVAGVAYRARIMPVRVLGWQGGSDFDICQAILFAAGLPNVSGTAPAVAADVINMSLGGPGEAPCFRQAIQDAHAAGSIVVVAAGNETQDAGGFVPANVPEAITVSATGPNNNRASYSNFGARIDVAAPGGEQSVPGGGVLSTLVTPQGQFTYDEYQGTSMAAPHIAGVVALMRSVHPDLTAEDLDLLLQGNHPQTDIRVTEDLGSAGFDSTYGHGLIDSVGAVRAAGELAGAPPVTDPILRANPASVDLTVARSSATIEVRNVGAGALVVEDVSTDTSWLRVDPTTGGEGSYNVFAETASLEDGVYQGRVTFSSNGGTARVAVQLSVGTPALAGGDVGTLYVLLIDEQNRVVAEAATSGAEGYAYRIANVAPGRYAVVAGTDTDDDTRIDNSGEAFGAHPEIVELTESIDGVDFTAGFEVGAFGG